MAVTDSKGQVTETYNYTPYGELIEGTYDENIPFLYNGQFGVTTDANGLYYMRARYYNVDIKRFINQDVLTGTLERISSLNRYAYVEGNPVSYLDPFGLDKWIYDEAHRWATHISYWISVVSVFLGPEVGLALGTFALGFNFGVFIAEMVYYGFSAESIRHTLKDMWRSTILYVLSIFKVSDAVRIYESLAGMVEAAYEEDRMHYPEMYDN